MIFSLLACDASTNEQSNAEIREELESTGVDPSSRLPYEHFFVGDEASMRAVVDDLADMYDVEIFAVDESLEDWAVVATRTAALDADELDEETAELERIAERHDGEYDGWGIPVDPDG